MATQHISIDPSALGAGVAYELLVGVIQPRPIALVSTLDADGGPNLAPFSFFMAGGTAPPSLVVSITLDGRSGPKDSLANISARGEFVVNIVERAMAEGMNATSYRFPAEFDEWAVAGFTPLASERVAPMRVAQSPVHLECMLHKIVPHGDSPGSANYVIGEIVRFHVAEHLWDGERLAGAPETIARLGGDGYLDTGLLDKFTLPRPTGSSDPSDPT